MDEGDFESAPGTDIGVELLGAPSRSLWFKDGDLVLGVPGEDVMAAKKLAGRGTGDSLAGTCIDVLVDFNDRLKAAGNPTL